MLKTVLHLFPTKTSKSECGVYGLMTNRLEDVTCEDCKKHYRETHKNDTVNVDVESKRDSLGIDSTKFALGYSTNF